LRGIILRFFLGVDVGGTTTTIALANEHLEVLHVSDQFATGSEAGPAAVIQAIVSQTEAAVGALGGQLSNLIAVGLATPGPATVDGVLLKAPNLDPELWNNFPIRQELEKAFQARVPSIRVRYIGDGQAAALGEYSVRAGKAQWKGQSDLAPVDITSLFMVIVGTGLGGGAVRHGKAVLGSQGRAGHVGHITLPAFAFRYEYDQQLLVGNSYCTAESVISLTGLTHQLKHRLTLDRWRNHPLNSTDEATREKAKKLRSLAADGDEMALEMFDDQARALGIALLNVNYLGDYDLLVIGGGVCDLAPQVRDRYRARAEETYKEYALDGFKNLPGFEFSRCGDNAPVIGALAWVRSHHAE